MRSFHILKTLLCFTANMMIGGAKVGEQSNKHFIVDCFPITAKRQKPLYIIEDGIMHPLALSLTMPSVVVGVFCVLYYIMSQTLTDGNRDKSGFIPGSFTATSHQHQQQWLRQHTQRQQRLPRG